MPFSHTEAFGMTATVIGAAIYFIAFKAFFREKANWQLIWDDMIPDNRYMCGILTEGKYPERIPLNKLLNSAEQMKCGFCRGGTPFAGVRTSMR